MPTHTIVTEQSLICTTVGIEAGTIPKSREIIFVRSLSILHRIHISFQLLQYLNISDFHSPHSTMRSKIFVLLLILSSGTSHLRHRLRQGANDDSGLTYITLEEHDDSPSVRSHQRKDAVHDLLINAFGNSLQPTLHNISIRLPNMNKNNIEMQVSIFKRPVLVSVRSQQVLGCGEQPTTICSS